MSHETTSSETPTRHARERRARDAADVVRAGAALAHAPFGAGEHVVQRAAHAPRRRAARCGRAASRVRRARRAPRDPAHDVRVPRGAGGAGGPRAASGRLPRSSICSDLPADARVAETERLVLEQARRPFDLSRDQILRVTRDPARRRRARAAPRLAPHRLRRLVARDPLPRALGAVPRGGGRRARPICPRCRSSTPTTRSGSASISPASGSSGCSATGAHELGDAEFVLELPTDFPRPVVPGTGGITERITIEPALLARIKQLGVAHDATLYMVLLAAYATVLHRYTGQPDVLVGSPSAGRSRAGDGRADRLLRQHDGPARAIRRRTRRSRELLDQLRESALGAYDHQEIPFEKLVLELQGGQQLSHSPLFQVVFTMLGGAGESGPVTLGDAEIRPYGVDDGDDEVRPHAVHVGARRRADAHAACTLRPVRAGDGATRARSSAHRARVGGRRTRRRASRSCPLLDARRARVSSRRGTTTRVDVGAPATIDALFDAQAARVPDRVGRRRGRRLAAPTPSSTRAPTGSRIGCARSASTADVPVGVVLDRSTDLVAAMLGVLKAGGAYVPVPPELPAARAAQQLARERARAS